MAKFDILMLRPLGNQTPAKHAIWCKNDGDMSIRLFSRAWQAITIHFRYNGNKGSVSENLTYVVKFFKCFFVICCAALEDIPLGLSQPFFCVK